MKITPSSFRSGVKWLGILVMFHAAAFFLYSITLSSMLKTRFDYGEIREAYTTVLIFDLVFWAIVAVVWVLRGQMSHDEVRRKIVTAQKEEGSSLIGYFCRTFLKDWLWRSLFFLVLQIPFAIFFANFGLALNDTITFFEKIYIADAGFYGATDSAPLGLLLSTLFFLAVMLLTSFLKCVLLLRNEQQ
ncbi:MAG: hypothetical protein IJ009_05080 [Clostridia bacterium]|nr:hypothetical protein [Clostridia bacterium]